MAHIDLLLLLQPVWPRHVCRDVGFSDLILLTVPLCTPPPTPPTQPRENTTPYKPKIKIKIIGVYGKTNKITHIHQKSKPPLVYTFLFVYKPPGFVYTQKENKTKNLLVYTQIMSIKPQPFIYTRKGQHIKHNTIGVYAKTSVKQGPCHIYTRTPTDNHIHQKSNNHSYTPKVSETKSWWL